MIKIRGWVLNISFTMALSKVTPLTLRDGQTIPIFGLGVYLAKANGETEQACLWALKHGYRMIDTATIYRNEEEVGRAIQKCGLPRDQLYISTKLWNSDHGKEKAEAALKTSLRKLGLDYVDLYLMHSPAGGATVESWKTMVELKKQGLAKSIGVSNFNIHHLDKLIEATPDDIPAVNQIELSPYLTWDNLVEYCQNKDIVIQAYSPLTKGEKLQDPKLVAIATKYNKSPAQVLIRWSLQRGFVCIPKSVKEERIVENGDIFDFTISDEDMATMNGWNEDLITGWDVINNPWIP